ERPPGEAHLAAAPDRVRHGAERRRLAGTVRSAHGDDLALVDAHRHAVERLHVAVACVDVLQLEQRRHSAPRYASITAGSARTSAGVPSAILRPKLRTWTRSETDMTRFMWC